MLQIPPVSLAPNKVQNEHLKAVSRRKKVDRQETHDIDA